MNIIRLYLYCGHKLRKVPTGALNTRCVAVAHQGTNSTSRFLVLPLGSWLHAAAMPLLSVVFPEAGKPQRRTTHDPATHGPGTRGSSGAPELPQHMMPPARPLTGWALFCWQGQALANYIRTCGSPRNCIVPQRMIPQRMNPPARHLTAWALLYWHGQALVQHAEV